MARVIDPAGCPTCGRGPGELHKATMKAPTIATLERWERSGGHKATDGCSGVDPDGTCQHGHLSWLRKLGWI